MKWLTDKIKGIRPGIIALNLGVFIVGTGIIGFFAKSFYENIAGIVSGQKMQWDWRILLDPTTWVYGVFGMVIIGLLYFVSDYHAMSSRSMREKTGLDAKVEGALENSRFLTDRERDDYFPGYF